MTDLLEPTFIGAVVTGIALLFLILVIPKFIKTKAVEGKSDPVITRDWQATGQINFVVPSGAEPDQKLTYILEIEEERIIKLLGGGASKEIRYRLATLSEAVDVVKTYRGAKQLDKL